MMSKMLIALCFGLLFAMETSSLFHRTYISETVVSFSTLKSDLELILTDPDKPRTVNIEYSEGAILRVTVLPNQSLPPEVQIHVNKKIDLKFYDGSTTERPPVNFSNGSFYYIYKNRNQKLFPTGSEQENRTYIDMKPNSDVKPKSAEKTITYIPTTVLTEGLKSKAKEMKKTKNRSFKSGTGNITLGSFSIMLRYDFESKTMHLKTPLKGISLSRNEVQPDVFMDVWYQLPSKHYGSSSRSFDGIDAVRVYDELYRQEDEAHTNGRALDDPHKLKPADQLKSVLKLVPISSMEKASNRAVIAKFESHLKAIQAAMRGGCDNSYQVYHFSITYKESIKLSYYCVTGSIMLKDGETLKLEALEKYGNKIINECHYFQYTNSQNILIECKDMNATPIAIPEKPRQSWLNDGTPTPISTLLMKSDMNLLKEILMKNKKSWRRKPTEGTSTLDGYKLFDMKLPDGEEHPSYVEVNAHFKVKSNSKDLFYEKLNFHEAKFTAPGHSSNITLQDAFIAQLYDYNFPNSSYIIISAYMTTKELQKDLDVASAEASIRCRARKNKPYLIKIVHLNEFVLEGSYQCFEQVFLFKGNFNALLLSKTGQNVEILTERPISNFIYVARDKFFIPGTESFDDVYAITLPNVAANFNETLKFYGSPHYNNLSLQTHLLFKSKEP